MRRAVGDWWELLIADGHVPATDLDCLAVGDIDGDGLPEVVTGGTGGLFWYRPGDWERHLIASGVNLHVGMALEDVDGDGRAEIFVGEETKTVPVRWQVCWYDLQPAVGGSDNRVSWVRHVVATDLPGGPHDLVFADVDGDGITELVANATYTATPGIHIYRRGPDATRLWRKHSVVEGIFTEGLSIADLDGDGRLEIVSGPDWYAAPAAGPFSGPWTRRTYAPNFREMCRTETVQIAGSGRPDILIVDSEYLDGRLSWFENRLGIRGGPQWIEHVLEEPLVYAHSLSARRIGSSVRVFVAEMEQGGWDAPPNHDARLLLYTIGRGGKQVARDLVCVGEGTHQAVLADVDGDGEEEIVGKTAEVTWHLPKVQVWKRRSGPAPRVHHQFVDRDKPGTGVELLTVDVDGDGRPDLACGRWWYRNPDWARFVIPGIFQVIDAFDIDRDGRQELIALKPKRGADPADWYHVLCSDLVWLKPIDPARGAWEEHEIGTGDGDWPHSSLVAPLLPGGKLALVTGYHDGDRGEFPQIWQIPDDPRDHPWPKRVLANIPYGEQMAACDVDGDGKLDVVAGPWWLESRGDGTFEPHEIAPGFVGARTAVWDVNGDGRPDVVLGSEVLDFEHKNVPLSAVAWFENPGAGASGPWRMHEIDVVRCAHSLAVGDIDGDGQPELVVGEHDPFWPYRSRSRLLVYRKADPTGHVWTSQCLDARFEHHVGTKIFEPVPGRPAIASHGWKDSLYVGLWEVDRRG